MSVKNCIPYRTAFLFLSLVAAVSPALGENPVLANIAASPTDPSTAVSKTMVSNAATVNTPPVLKSQGTIQAKEGQVLSLHLSAGDADGDELHFSLVEGPVNLGVSSNGLLQWVPSFEDAGSHRFTVELSDGKATVQGAGVIDVANSNRLPKISSDAVTEARENNDYEYYLSSDDDDGDALTYTLLQGPKGMTLADDALIWRPGFDDAGKHPVSVQVSDGEDKTQQDFTISVSNNNRAPAWKLIAMASVKEGGTLVVPLEATDADGDTLSFSIATGPNSMKIDSASVLHWAPDYDAAGQYVIELLVSDGEHSITQSFSVEVVDVNRAPTFTSKPVTRTAEAREYNYLLQVRDADKQNIILTLKEAPEGMVLKDRQLHWMPGYEQAGMYPVVIQASDGEAIVEQAFSLKVENTNRAPIWQMTELPAGKESVAYTALLKAVDADGDGVKYTLASGPRTLVVSPAGLVEWLPDFDASGIHQLKLIADDGEAKTAVSLAIQIENTNRAPEFTAQPPLMAAENTPWAYAVQTQDADGDPLTTTLLQGPPGITLKDGRLQWLASFEQAGSYPIRLKLDDGQIAVEQAFTLVVSNTNRKPVFSQPQSGSLRLAEGQSWQLELQATDADGETLELALSAAPEGVKLIGNLLQWTPGYVQAGPEKIRVSASDAESVTYLTLDVTVANTNRAPIISSAPVLNAKEDSPYEYELLASDADILEDASTTETLGYKILQGPEGMSFTANRLRWRPTFEQAGEHLIKVQVSDGDLNVQQSFTLTVENTNRAPIFDSDPQTYVLEDMIYEEEIEVRDLDGDIIELSVENAPPGMVLDKRVLQWRPGFFDAGDYTIVLKATDGNLQTTQQFILMVDNNNRLPVFTSKPVTIAHESMPYRYQIKVEDQDHEQLGLTMLSAPEGMTMAANGLIKWRPAFHQKGDHNVKISVSDGHDIVYQSYYVEVVDTNREPTVTVLSSHEIVAGEKFRYKVQAEDVDGDKLSYQLVHGPKGMEINSSGKIYWRPGDADVGSHKVIISVSDGDLKVRKHFEIRVHEDARD